MANELPAITGEQLLKLLLADGWEVHGRRTHGVAVVKRNPGGIPRRTIIPLKKRPLANTTLGAILGPKQSGIGRTGLVELIARYGLK